MKQQHTESNFICHTPCPKCGSSDACALFDDGHSYCYSCQTYFPPRDSQPKPKGTQKMSKELLSMEDFAFRDIKPRGLTKETCQKYGYFTGMYKDQPVHVACYYDDKGKMVGQKIRFPDKTFTIKGKIGNHLFGANLWAGDKMIVITEGEIDALTVSQVQGNKYPTVSIPNGAQSAKKVIEANLEYLSQYEKVILMFDMDEAGRKAVDECVEVLPTGKAYIANLPMKDANRCLLNGKANEIITAIWNAKPYRPDGIVSGTDLEEKCVKGLEDLKDSVPYPWEALNNKTKGARLGELYVFTSGSGMGKSTILRELEYYFGVEKKEKCGIIALEESTQKTGLELMSIHLNKRLLVEDKQENEETLRQAFKDTVGNGNFYLYDHFGSLDSSNLLSKVRYMVVSLGCKRIFLDHISIVVSGMDNADEGGERKAIDMLMTNLRSLVEETGCTLFVVSHLKRPDKKGHEEGAQVSLAQLRGSGAIAQLSDMVIGLERNQQGDNPNILTLRVLKNRFTGDTGIGGTLRYNPRTGRLADLGYGFTNEYPNVALTQDTPF